MSASIQELLDDAAIDAEWSLEDQISVLIKFIEEQDLSRDFTQFLQEEVDSGLTYDHGVADES